MNETLIQVGVDEEASDDEIDADDVLPMEHIGSPDPEGALFLTEVDESTRGSTVTIETLRNPLEMGKYDQADQDSENLDYFEFFFQKPCQSWKKFKQTRKKDYSKVTLRMSLIRTMPALNMSPFQVS